MLTRKCGQSPHLSLILKEIGIAKVRFSMIATKSIEKRALSVLTTLKEMKEKENP